MFERDLPGENKAGLSGQSVSSLPLETCETMNGMWGYKITDQDYKSTKTLIHYLVKAAGKDANLLMNIGPQPDGELPAVALERLAEVGKHYCRQKCNHSARNGKPAQLLRYFRAAKTFRRCRNTYPKYILNLSGSL